MTKSKTGSGRILTMVGIIAVVAVPLAILAPSLSKDFAQKDEQTERLEPVLESQAARAPGSGMTRDSGASTQNQAVPNYGEPTSFGEPTMNPSSPDLASPEPEDRPMPSTASAAARSPASTSAAKRSLSPNTRLATPTNRAPRLSQSDIERRAAAMLGLPTQPTRKSVQHRTGKAENSRVNGSGP